MGRGTVRNLLISGAALGLAAAPVAAQQRPESVEPSPHISAWPDLRTGNNEIMRNASWALGPELQRGRSAREMLAERRRLNDAIDAIQPQRPGTVDAYVVSIALDSDPVFAREAREAGTVLSRRYDSAGRTLVLAGPDGREAGLPRGSLHSLTIALARIAEVMDPAEDVLVLFTTSHGTPEGIAYHDGDTGYGMLSPLRLRNLLGELGLERRILMLSACYSGVFVPQLATPNTALVTAASHDRTSFGCLAQNDWTFFGDAFVNNALRKPQTLNAAVEEAKTAIAGWEAGRGLTPSQPQMAIGASVGRWLGDLEARMPRDATQPVGQPSVDSLDYLMQLMGRAQPQPTGIIGR